MLGGELLMRRGEHAMKHDRGMRSGQLLVAVLAVVGVLVVGATAWAVSTFDSSRDRGVGLSAVSPRRNSTSRGGGKKGDSRRAGLHGGGVVKD